MRVETPSHSQSYHKDDIMEVEEISPLYGIKEAGYGGEGDDIH
jgi:hypothetical protein